MNQNSETNKQKLLDITPVILQDTSTILNTLIFMCLDQGHDFRAGDSRTTTNDGQSTWVDLDFYAEKKVCYLNKINKQKFEDNYYKVTPSDPTAIKTINSDLIFGQNDFIKGLLNTTFVGGNGNYGMVLIEDSQLAGLGENPEQLIAQELSNTIQIKLKSTSSYYYIYSDNDFKGDSGLNLKINESTILFLPFYQRVYNNDMHKLWTFNTKKHVYLIKLNELSIVNENDILKFQTPTFICEPLNTIDLIVPQYVMNFGEYYETNLKLYKKSLAKYMEENKELLKQSFLTELFTGVYKSNEFTFPREEISPLENIPRGVKYYFPNCQVNGEIFNIFLKWLYQYQKPFIHPSYKISESDNKSKFVTIEQSKIDINNKLLGNVPNNSSTFLDMYNDIKIGKKSLEESGSDVFLLKQYGFITDTNIGNSKNKSTSDILIDSLNDLPYTTDCVTSSGGQNIVKMTGGKLDIDTQNECDKINVSMSLVFNPRYEKLKEYLNKNPQKCAEACTYVKEKYSDILQKFGKLDEFNRFCEKCQQTTGIEEPIKDVKPLELVIQPISFDRQPVTSEGTTTDETTTSEPTTMKSESVTPISTSSVGKKDNSEFNNLQNANEVFGLGLTDSEVSSESLVKINSNTTDDNLDKFDNNLQLYYNFIPQNQVESENKNRPNYFNNCWNSTIFYQPEAPQSGGSNYPFKFTIASGQLDSSSLGGQSIPQYHAPEVDVYMPIFELSGEGKLKGIIVRMVFVKDVRVNSINSKSQATIFCHFVYVDFYRTRISEPNNTSEYPSKIGELLEYTIKNTVFIENNPECVDIDGIKNKDNLNEESDIDFELQFPDDESRKVSRRWYKYFTYSQGPTVQKSIVIPTNFNSILGLKKSVSHDYVAEGIVNVAENLIKNSNELRTSFGVPNEEIDNDSNYLFFIKLFLIRNKYTGDKSRSTDTLFLNQTKYLEGVQISNDENTLYNSQMFGLNTIWSTSSKSIFYMAPYLTESGQAPITSGFYVDELCKGLKSNPNFKSSTSGSQSKLNVVIDDEYEQINEFKAEILNTMNLDIIPDNVKNLFDINVNNTIIEDWSNGLYQLSNLYTSLNDIKETSIVEELTQAINTYKDAPDRRKALQELQNKTINKLTKIISDNNNHFNEIYENIITQKDHLYQKLSYMATEFENKSDLNNLFKMILFLNKTFPWWVEMIISNMKIDFDNKLCSDYIIILDALNDLLKEDSTLQYCDKFQIYKTILSNIKYFEENIKIDCFTITDSNDKKLKTSTRCPQKAPIQINPIQIEKKPLQEKVIFLKSIDQQEIEDLPKEEQDRLIQLNDDKFNNISVDFLEKLRGLTNPDENLSKQDPNEITRLAQETSVVKKQAPIPLKVQKLIRTAATIVQEQNVPKDETKIENETLIQNETIRQDELGGGPIENNTINTSENKITSETLNDFYLKTYKYNIGNHLKSFIPLIQDIDTKYPNKDLNLQDDTPKDFNYFKDLINKILLIYIDYINTSFIPKINTNTILDELEKIKNTDSVDQMNTILNMYSRQLDIYMVINRIMNVEELSNIDLINIINDNLNYNTYNSLNIPFTLLQLKYKLLKAGISEENPKMFSKMLSSLIPSLPNLPSLPKFQPNFSQFSRGAVDKGIVAQKDLAQGAGSLKHKKNKKHSNTMNNKNRNKKRNNKNTRKRKNKKMKRYTRKN
jgi:hypothetical protein